MARHTAKSHKIRKVEILVIQMKIFRKIYNHILSSKKVYLKKINGESVGYELEKILMHRIVLLIIVLDF